MRIAAACLLVIAVGCQRVPVKAGSIEPIADNEKKAADPAASAGEVAATDVATRKKKVPHPEPEPLPEPRVDGYWPDPIGKTKAGPLGVTGIDTRMHGKDVAVEKVQPGTPAVGKFRKGDILVGVNGAPLEGKYPYVVLGRALTRAEGSDGRLVFDVRKGADDAVTQVTVTIPATGSYRMTWPLDCNKSKGIVREAAEFYSSPNRLKGHNLVNALTCLFLLSTGDDKYVPRVKQYFGQFLDGAGNAEGLEDHHWHNGYNGIACAEYYLRTGDKTVLPILQHYCDSARDSQMWGAAWGHWGRGIDPSYEGAGGLMNAAGTQVMTTLVMGKYCGVEVDDKTLLNALRFWYRFIGHGNIPVSDHRGYISHIKSGGKYGGTAAAMHIATHARGDTSIYTRARDYLARAQFECYPQRAYSWDAQWLGLASAHVRESNPELYRRGMHRHRWWLDLSRQADGSFSPAGIHVNFDRVDLGVILALYYTAPMKTLQITGAPRSKFATDFTLPARLWGTEADMAFLSPKHHPDFHKYGAEDDSHVLYRQLFENRRDLGARAKLPLGHMEKNVRHAKYVVRAQAAKVLRTKKEFGILEQLLSNPDPRLRRAGLDGINDIENWFGNSLWGRRPLKTEEYTPAMTMAIERILADPNESWFVKDGALLALHHAPVKAIEENIDAILPWTTHDDWWLRESAFMALVGLKRDDALLLKHLPRLVDMLVDEYHTSPQINMRKALLAILKEKEEESPEGQMIAAGLLRAIKEVKILPGHRASEGQYAPYITAKRGIEVLPGMVYEFADVLKGSLESIGDRWLLDILGTPNINRSLAAAKRMGRFRYGGLYPEMTRLTGDKRAAMRDLLFNTFRPEMLKRIPRLHIGRNKQEQVRDKMKMLNAYLDITKLKKDIRGWHPIGSPAPGDRVWRHYSFDPLPKESIPKRDHSKRRLRDVTLPAGMDKWYMPDFDDSQWRTGRSPIGVGVYMAGGHGVAPNPDLTLKNNSNWGAGEFLLMRTTFDVKDLDYKHFCLSVLAKDGYAVYLNGHKLHTYIWFQSVPHYKQWLLSDKIRSHLKKGTNTLAIRAVAHYGKSKNGEYPAIGQADGFIEGVKERDLVDTQ